METEIDESRILSGVYTTKNYKRGSVFPYRIVLPKTPSPKEETALLVGHDGLVQGDVFALDALREEDRAPACVILAVSPAELPATLPERKQRNMRLDDYDLFTSGYADFIVYELIPYLRALYGDKFSFSDDPDLHAVRGGSSGGISAFCLAWFHPEFFRRVYMSSPSFLAMNRGNEVPVLIRKCETKPLRVYTEFSENEPDDYFGSSYCAAMEAERALRFAGYDFRSEYFPGLGHCARQFDAGHLYEVYSFLWNNWRTEPLRAPRNSPRVDCVVPFGSVWERCDAFPGKEPEPDVRIPETETPRTAAVLSSDGWMLYVSEKYRAAVSAYPVSADGTPGARYLHGMLHTRGDTVLPGALDLCVDECDRVYAATELGIQCIRSFGLIDVILDNPGGKPARRLAFDPAGGPYLYAETDDGCYRRKMIARGKHAEPTEPRFTSYFD